MEKTKSSELLEEYLRQAPKPPPHTVFIDVDEVTWVKQNIEYMRSPEEMKDSMWINQVPVF